MTINKTTPDRIIAPFGDEYECLRLKGNYAFARPLDGGNGWALTNLADWSEGVEGAYDGFWSDECANKFAAALQPQVRESDEAFLEDIYQVVLTKLTKGRLNETSEDEEGEIGYRIVDALSGPHRIQDVGVREAERIADDIAGDCRNIIARATNTKQGG